MTLPVIGATAANGEMQQLWPSFAPEIQLNLYYADGTGSCPPPVQLMLKVPNWGFSWPYLFDFICMQFRASSSVLAIKNSRKTNGPILKTAQLTSNARPGLNRRLPGGDLLIKIPDGDPTQTITKLDCQKRNRHQERWLCSHKILIGF
jgi:hypothetical protein